MPILEGSYNTPDAARQLVLLGDLSQLAEIPCAPEGHSYETPVNGHCVAYRRDRGETGVDAFKGKSLDECLEYNSQEYNYFFNGSKWEIV